MLATRLEKLEKDLNLLTAIQTVLTCDDQIGARSDSVEIPERDCNNNNNKVNGNNFGSHVVAGENYSGPGRGPGSRRPITKATATASTLALIARQTSCGCGSSSNGIHAINSSNHETCMQKGGSNKDKSKNDNCFNPHGKSGAGEMTRKTVCTPTISDADTREMATGDLQQEQQLPQHEDLHQELRAEKERRSDIEESAKRIAIKLQKVEDELGREVEMKKMLLVGTLQLKNQIHGYENRISQLQEENQQAKNDKLEMRTELEALNAAEKERIGIHYTDLLGQLELQKNTMENDNKMLQENLQTLQKSYEELRKQCIRKDEILSSSDQKSTGQLTLLVTKCAKIDKERQSIGVELQKTVSKALTLESELNAVNDELIKLKGESDREKVLQQCRIQKIRSDVEVQKSQVAAQMRACHSVLGRTKEIFLQVRKERDESQKYLKECRRENQELSYQKDVMRKQGDALEEQSANMKEKLNSILVENMQQTRKLQREKSLLQKDVRKLSREKKKLVGLLMEAKTQFSDSQTRLEERAKNSESDKKEIKQELCKLQENFQVLQKIYQEQGNTVQKLRGEGEEHRKLKFSLETQLRERDAEVSTLSRKLDQEKRNCSRLEDQIEELQYRLTGLQDDLKSHSCEDFVESEWKGKVEQIESTLRTRYSEWQRSLQATKSERDQAVTAARKSMLEVEETKASYEKKILETVSSSLQERSKLQAQNQRISSENAAKIYEQESELERLKQQSNQIQRSLSLKIQQLQCALNICLGSNTTPAAFGNSIGPGLSNSSSSNFFL